MHRCFSTYRGCNRFIYHNNKIEILEKASKGLELQIEIRPNYKIVHLLRLIA
jgi:hypothetical protein